MKMIKLKYKQHPLSSRRKKVITLGGFELEAPQSYDFRSDIGPVRMGALTTQFRLDIPTNGECEIPDTQYNRDKLKAKFELESDKKTKYYIFDILSNINLEEEAPHAGGGSITKDEERSLKQQIQALELKNKLLSADAEMKRLDKVIEDKKIEDKKVKTTGKKTGGKAKKVDEGKAPEGLNLSPDLV